LKFVVAIGLPLAYLAGVVCVLRPPPPRYVTHDRTQVTVEDHGESEVLHAPDPIYPPAALRAGIEGTVKLRVEVDASGRAGRIDAISGPEPLVQAAIAAVNQWQFVAHAMETEVQVPFLLWHPGPRTATIPEPLKRAPVTAPAGAHGVVRVVVMVDQHGRVEFVQPVSGPRRLIQHAVASVRQWIFRPALRDGKPDRSTAVVDVPFP
jgi:TonB family protein